MQMAAIQARLIRSLYRKAAQALEQRFCYLGSWAIIDGDCAQLGRRLASDAR